jgi:hypothetical protein
MEQPAPLVQRAQLVQPELQERMEQQLQPGQLVPPEPLD